jgi:hypothetical protein
MLAAIFQWSIRTESSIPMAFLTSLVSTLAKLQLSRPFIDAGVFIMDNSILAENFPK